MPCVYDIRLPNPYGWMNHMATGCKASVCCSNEPQDRDTWLWYRGSSICLLLQPTQSSWGLNSALHALANFTKPSLASRLDPKPNFIARWPSSMQAQDHISRTSWQSCCGLCTMALPRTGRGSAASGCPHLQQLSILAEMSLKGYKTVLKTYSSTDYFDFLLTQIWTFCVFKYSRGTLLISA